MNEKKKMSRKNERKSSYKIKSTNWAIFNVDKTGMSIENKKSKIKIKLSPIKMFVPIQLMQHIKYENTRFHVIL